MSSDQTQGEPRSVGPCWPASLRCGARLAVMVNDPSSDHWTGWAVPLTDEAVPTSGVAQVIMFGGPFDGAFASADVTGDPRRVELSGRSAFFGHHCFG